jgi:hypothetical protein
MARKKRLAAALIPPEPPPSPADPPQPAAEAMPVGRTVDGALAASTEHRPAAYQFALRDDGKIDVLPAAPEPQDCGFAIDLYGELVRKSRDLIEAGAERCQ